MFGFGWDCQRCSYKQVYYAGFYPSQNNVQTHVPSRSSLMTRKKCVAASAHAEILPSVVWYVSPQSITARRVWGWKQKETLWPSYITVSHSGFLLSADLRVRSTEGEAEQPPWNHRKCPFISLIHIFVLANAAPSVILSLSLSLSIACPLSREGQIWMPCWQTATKTILRGCAFNLQWGFDAVVCGGVEQISH